MPKIDDNLNIPLSWAASAFAFLLVPAIAVAMHLQRIDDNLVAINEKLGIKISTTGNFFTPAQAGQIPYREFNGKKDADSE